MSLISVVSFWLGSFRSGGGDRELGAGRFTGNFMDLRIIFFLVGCGYGGGFLVTYFTTGYAVLRAYFGFSGS